MRPECDPLPSLYRVGWIAAGAMRWTVVIALAGLLGGIVRDHLDRFDPRLLRAACASRAASQRARSLVSIASIPRRSEAVAVITAAWDAEARAWAAAPVECE